MSAFTDRHTTPEVIAGELAEFKKKAREAAAWGVPDQESIGMSQDELCTMLFKALKWIEYLERKLEQK